METLNDLAHSLIKRSKTIILNGLKEVLRRERGYDIVEDEATCFAEIDGSYSKIHFYQGLSLVLHPAGFANMANGTPFVLVETVMQNNTFVVYEYMKEGDTVGPIPICIMGNEIMDAIFDLLFLSAIVKRAMPVEWTISTAAPFHKTALLRKFFQHVLYSGGYTFDRMVKETKKHRSCMAYASSIVGVKNGPLTHYYTNVCILCGPNNTKSVCRVNKDTLPAWWHTFRQGTISLHKGDYTSIQDVDTFDPATFDRNVLYANKGAHFYDVGIFQPT